ncbi:hypothetical protein DSOL_3435 [Desulfosporosinus metallidurans]|uniref:Uncharacterized protein n=1 Tax=Desulfosporosinus metallidurans TaxID=1888891 RepID=A0A1Q8QQV1_9FIRM|nr:hypothetical protein DSOL_3435 [Desulfosporosinus metallidurans]
MVPCIKAPPFSVGYFLISRLEGQSILMANFPNDIVGSNLCHTFAILFRHNEAVN